MAALLAAASEDFLAGRLVEHDEFNGQPVPVWAWTNLLAHGSEQDLRAISDAPQLRRSRTEKQWQKARSYLANEVLLSAESNGTLSRVQKSVLVPLELDLASRSDVSRWSPALWVKAVERALAEQGPVGSP